MDTILTILFRKNLDSTSKSNSNNKHVFIFNEIGLKKG